ncbi:CPBP family intramembrane metalloprotease [Parapedobacter sp. ISTM3]|uniref:CPBP family glutamic-type intramembrane protease n=1 Tax=Parapedobacter sp. ISTM3 TaxID=2800130 RepID=UPI001903EF42|nr:CPBP family glutamic-type intramembrane protease [Parapedobacter sp. ISTM3]MBK1442401.1 CPBP family intramembrane metalloprotease [Parapedobacter sp. ISTM3]
MSTIPFWLKGIITGILWAFWHLLIFDSFDPFGGLHIFVLLCIIVSIIMAYATDKTNSLLVAASIHALMMLRDMKVTVLCAVVWLVLILFWKNLRFMPKTR